MYPEIVTILCELNWFSFYCKETKIKETQYDKQKALIRSSNSPEPIGNEKAKWSFLINRPWPKAYQSIRRLVLVKCIFSTPSNPYFFVFVWLIILQDWNLLHLLIFKRYKLQNPNRTKNVTHFWVDSGVHQFLDFNGHVWIGICVHLDILSGIVY